MEGKWRKQLSSKTAGILFYSLFNDDLMNVTKNCLEIDSFRCELDELLGVLIEQYFSYEVAKALTHACPKVLKELKRRGIRVHQID